MECSREKFKRQQVTLQKEILINLLVNANKSDWGVIDELISEYSPISILSEVPDEMIPELTNRIAKALSKGLLKKSNQLLE